MGSNEKIQRDRTGVNGQENRSGGTSETTVRPKKHRLRHGLLGVVLALVMLMQVPLIRSLVVMKIYSQYHYQGSLLQETGLTLEIPGGLDTRERDWYPNVMFFSADPSYSQFRGEPEARMSILYNIPSFSMAAGCSRLYDPASPYYNGFYGAYVVRDSRVGISPAQGMPSEDYLADLVSFDFFWLVMGDFGLKPEDRVRSFTVEEREENGSYAGLEGWTKIRSKFIINGMAHNSVPKTRSYLQYGAPNFGEIKEPFSPVTMEGLLYGRYFPEEEVCVYFYVMAADREAVDACDQNLLSKSTLKQRERS